MQNSLANNILLSGVNSGPSGRRSGPELFTNQAPTANNQQTLPNHTHADPTLVAPATGLAPPPERAVEASTAVIWDGWPDGDFSQLFTWNEFLASNKLAVHWACTALGGDKVGNDDAENWEQGKTTSRRCNGIIKCNNPLCMIVIRPQTRTVGIQKQLQEPCKCKGQLQQIPCRIVSRLHQFRHGVYYQNGGINGPQESVAEISPVLLNKDQIKAEKQKAKSKNKGPEDFISQFSAFEEKHPGFIRSREFGSVTVITVQTDFMASLLVKMEDQEESINGIVSDAAHGYWKIKTNLLIISSVYCPPLQCWVPGIISYSNGSSQEHYLHHFLALFEGIAIEAEKRDMNVTDELFGNVVDFGGGQRAGFIAAFIQFWRNRSENDRSIEELSTVATTLLKGCRQHFRAQVQRISNISAVVHPSL
ncbi:hypothetical protein GALMADRAFT_77388, partial [Galerina marginata CBS 339.88]